MPLSCHLRTLLRSPRAKTNLWLCLAALSFHLALPSSSTAQTLPGQGPDTPFDAIGCPLPAPVMPTSYVDRFMAKAPDRGLLWRIEKNGVTSWLYGTAHIARPEWSLPGPGVFNALRESDMLAVEMNLLDAESLKPFFEFPPPQVLARILTAPRAARIQRQLALACLPPNALDAMRPGMQVATLLVLKSRADGLYVEYGIDMMLASVAMVLKKPIVALETAKDQTLLIAGRNEGEERFIVDSTLDAMETNKSQNQMRTLMQAWAAGDLGTLEKYFDWCECLDKPEEKAFMKRLLDDRNKPMAQKIDRLHSQGKRVFVGVGALHMVGRQGLPALMRARGYRVEAVAHVVDRPDLPPVADSKAP